MSHLLKRLVSADTRDRLRAHGRTAAAQYAALDARVDAALTRTAAAARTQLVVACVAALLVLGAPAALAAVGGEQLSGAGPVLAGRVAGLVLAVLGGLLAGPLANLLGPRLLLAAAAVAALFDVGARTFLLTREDNKESLAANGVQFALFAAAFAAAARAAVFAAVAPAVLTYAKESRRGVAAAAMLSITGLCLVAAEAVNVALTWSKDRMPLLPVYTYWVCLLIPLIGWAFSILVLHPWKVVRDGHSILEGAKPTVRGEIIQAKALFSNPGLWTLGACAALMSYYNGTTLSFSPVSLNSTFTDSVRMMSLLRLIYQVTYILGAWIISLAFLDNTNHTRSKRARMTSAMLIVFLMAVLVGTYIKTVTAYASYSLYGLFDGFTHTFFVWLLACFSNNPLKQARYVGFLYAIYYLTSAIKFALTENVEAIVSYDKFICIGMVVLALIMYGTFNFKYVTDTCVDDEDDVEEEVEFKTNVVESIQLEPGVSESGKVERYNEKEVLASAAKKVAFADSR